MKISLDKIEQNENSRVIYKEQDLAELMGSMKLHGLLQPVGVRKIQNGRYDAVFGNRRIVAAKKLGWGEIDCHILDAPDEINRDILNLIENIQRKNTTVAEDGRMFKLLIQRNLTIPEIAARVGVSKERIQLALDVVQYIPVEFHKDIPNNSAGAGAKRNGKISPHITHQIMNLRKSHSLNRKQVRALVAKAKEGLSQPQIQRLAPLISAGKTMELAFAQIDKIRRIQLEIFVDVKEAETVEKKTGYPIRAFLINELIKCSSLKSIQPIKLVSQTEK